MSTGQHETRPDQKPALDLARYELEYRRKKQWDIFSWVVTILVSVIGGIIALTSKGEINPDLVSRVTMAVALGSLTAYAAIWIDENIVAEKKANDVLKTLLSGVGVEYPIKEPAEFRVGYVLVVILIGVAAVIAVLFVNLLPLGLVLK